MEGCKLSVDQEMKKKIIWTITSFVLPGWVDKGYGKEGSISDNLIRPLTCKDILIFSYAIVP